MTGSLGGKPERAFDEQEKKFAQYMSMVGRPREEIADVLDCTPKTLSKHLGDMLDTAKEKASAKVISTAYRMATSGKDRAMTMFWLKTQCGWRETQKVDVTTNGESIQAPTILPANGHEPDDDE